MQRVERSFCTARSTPCHAPSARRAAAAGPRHVTNVAHEARTGLDARACALLGERLGNALSTRRAGGKRRSKPVGAAPCASLVPEFAPSQVTVDEPLGEGSFGQVYLGTLTRPGKAPETGARPD